MCSRKCCWRNYYHWQKLFQASSLWLKLSGEISSFLTLPVNHRANVGTTECSDHWLKAELTGFYASRAPVGRRDSNILQGGPRPVKISLEIGAHCRSGFGLDRWSFLSERANAANGVEITARAQAILGIM